MATTLKINGTAHQVDLPNDVPLLWVLRDEVGLTGTKFGCGIAQCGACTVHLNGAAIRSCITPVSAAEGAKITTIEGLDSAEGQALQKAWVSEQVPQCGYCQSGQIMTAETLLRSNPSPSEEQIVTTMNGNLCRCMSYTRIKKAIQVAAEEGA